MNWLVETLVLHRVAYALGQQSWRFGLFMEIEWGMEFELAMCLISSGL